MSSPNRLPALLAALALLGLTAWAVGLCRKGPEPAQVRAKSADLDAAAVEVSLAEPEWWTASLRGFPGDVWSQDDHFHNLEQQRVLYLAERYGVSPAEILLMVQVDIRKKRIPGRRVTTVPIKPRSFYD